jgi:hypothetical protein
MTALQRASTLLLLVAFTPCDGDHASAQNARIYPVYEGWLPNEDGSATLVFGYFNESLETVQVAPGARNGFSPGAADRGQPSLFRPGRQRNVCAMVVGPEHEGNLRWSIEWNGHSTATTEHGGRDPLYLLEEIGPAARAARGIDTAAVARDVCLNRAPTPRAGEDQKVASLSTRLQGFVFDEGLPRDGVLTVAWRLVSGPGTAAFASSSDPLTRVDFSAPGSYELELVANDSAASASDRVVVVVGPSEPP